MNPVALYAIAVISMILVITSTISYLYSSYISRIPEYVPAASSIEIRDIDWDNKAIYIVNYAGVRYDTAAVIRYARADGTNDIKMIPVTLYPGGNVVSISVDGTPYDGYILVGTKWYRITPGRLSIQETQPPVIVNSKTYSLAGLGVMMKPDVDSYGSIQLSSNTLLVDTNISVSAGYYRSVCNIYIYERVINYYYGSFCKQVGTVTGSFKFIDPVTFIPTCLPATCPVYDVDRTPREDKQTFACTDPYPCLWLSTISSREEAGFRMPFVNSPIDMRIFSSAIYLSSSNSTSSEYAVRIGDENCWYTYSEIESTADIYSYECGDDECDKILTTHCIEIQRTVYQEKRFACEDGQACAALFSFLSFGYSPYGKFIQNSTARLEKLDRYMNALILESNSTLYVSYRYEPPDLEMLPDPELGVYALRIEVEVVNTYKIPGFFGSFGIRYNESISNYRFTLMPFASGSANYTVVEGHNPLLFYMNIYAPRNISGSIDIYPVSNPLVRLGEVKFFRFASSADQHVVVKAKAVIYLPLNYIEAVSGKILVWIYTKLTLIPVVDVDVIGYEIKK